MAKRKYGRRTKRRSKRGTRRRRVYKRGRGSVAHRALKLAKRLANHSEETVYLSQTLDSDVATPGLNQELTNLSLYNRLFLDDDGTRGAEYKVHGNKIYSRYLKARWEIHMDNVNNEEETCNFTVAVVSFKADADQTFAFNGWSAALAKHTASANGQAFFDPRYVKVHYYKYFTRTMGGTAPGTAGESSRYGSFKLNVNKMQRLISQGNNYTTPTSFQDRLFFVVLTDNSAVDTENPRINAHFMWCIKDTDTLNNQ